MLILVLLPSLTAPATAGIFFGKKGTKPTPTEHVPELIATLQTSGDENKRVEAVEELRQYDPAQFPQIVPALIEALQSDRKPAVRSEAAASLSKIRPVSPQVGQALEQTLSKDSSMRVRLQARSALLQYHWAGYRAGTKPVETPLPQSKEPPTAIPETKEPPRTATPAVAPTPQPKPAPQPMPPVTAPQPMPTPSGSRPLPVGPDLTPPEKPVPPSEEKKGPDLIPPD
jgi:hypothetical protein